MHFPLCASVKLTHAIGTKKYVPQILAEREILPMMLELVTQLDGFDLRGEKQNKKLQHLTDEAVSTGRLDSLCLMKRHRSTSFRFTQAR